MTSIVGYDIGGANLKVARVENGRLVAVRQVACPLWQGLEHLDAALDATHEIAKDTDAHAITMTGELCELFSSRRDGVEKITAHMSTRIGSSAQFFMGLKGFGDAPRAITDTDATGSANFLATAVLIAKQAPRALLIDMGSTTTDIIACDRPQGLTDAERLQTGELVYTGLTRTPVPSITTRGLLLGQWQGLARDAFANTADVRRVLGSLAHDADKHETTDGRGKSQEDSLRRFARGFGRDGEMRHLAGWQAAAANIRDKQLSSIIEGARQVLSRPGIAIDQVVTAGIGHDEAAEVARRLNFSSMTFGELIGAPAHLQRDGTHAAPACAVALLLQNSAKDR